MKHQLNSFLTGTLIAVVLLVVTACQPLEPLDRSVMGASGPKEGEVSQGTDLPEKGAKEDLPPINPEGGEKSPVDQAEETEAEPIEGAGEGSVKEPATDVEPLPGVVSKAADEQRVETGRYGQADFRVTSDGIEPLGITVLDGELLPSETIDGEFMYVFTLEGEPVYTGTFRDPLVAIGLPMEPGQGYSATQMEEGYFSISIPGELLVPDRMAESSLEIYRLDPTVPYTYTLTPETASELRVRSDTYLQIDGEQMVEFLPEEG